ncbi:MAG: hypothetical protein HFJ35_08145 [Clostridia bacterium]|nr:hypothetical protein [Clostridia bacterium]
MADSICQIRKKGNNGKQLIDKETISNELAEEIKKLVLEARKKYLKK